MADFRRHITVSTVCGIAYGGLVVNPLGYSAETGFLAAGLTAVGGMIPDLDSDSGIPVREMSNLGRCDNPTVAGAPLDCWGNHHGRGAGHCGVSLSLHSICRRRGRSVS